MTHIIAHRGASSDAPENSLAAFRRARHLKADGVELDIHVTRDQVAIVHHDPSIGGSVIADESFDRIARYRLANGEAIPTLEEALAELEGLAVYVEVKELPATADDAFFAVLDNGPTPNRYQVHAFDHRIVRRLQRLRPDFEYGVLACSYAVSPLAALKESQARVLWQLQTLIDVDLVQRAHDGGYGVIAWTADEPHRIRELVDLGVDGVCTNRPDVAQRII